MTKGQDRFLVIHFLGIQTAVSEVRKELLKATSNLINLFIKAAAVDIYSLISLLSSHAVAS